MVDTPQLRREDLAGMSPSEVAAAVDAGALASVMGATPPTDWRRVALDNEAEAKTLQEATLAKEAADRHLRDVLARNDADELEQLTEAELDRAVALRAADRHQGGLPALPRPVLGQGANSGAGTGRGGQLGRDDLRGLSPAEIARAHDEGRLQDLFDGRAV